MTILVGVKCSDGVVIGADSATTTSGARQNFSKIPSDKLCIIGNRVILAGTGSVGLGQRFESIVQSAWDQKLFNKSCGECSQQISTASIQNFRGTFVQFSPQIGYGFGALMAAPFNDNAELIEFSLEDMQPEIKRNKIHFVSMGSGQMLADPFLAFISRVLWKNGTPDVETAKFGVYWALSHTIECAPGGVGHPVSLAILKRESGRWNARILDAAEMGESSQYIDELEKKIGSELFVNAEPQAVPPPPK